VGFSCEPCIRTALLSRPSRDFAEQRSRHTAPLVAGRDALLPNLGPLWSSFPPIDPKPFSGPPALAKRRTADTDRGSYPASPKDRTFPKLSLLAPTFRPEPPFRMRRHCGRSTSLRNRAMLDEIIIGLVGGAIGEKLFRRWSRRRPRLTMLICIPPLLLIAALAGMQMLNSGK